MYYVKRIFIHSLKNCVRCYRGGGGNKLHVFFSVWVFSAELFYTLHNEKLVQDILKKGSTKKLLFVLHTSEIFIILKILNSFILGSVKGILVDINNVFSNFTNTDPTLCSIILSIQCTNTSSLFHGLYQRPWLNTRNIGSLYKYYAGFYMKHKNLIFDLS